MELLKNKWKRKEQNESLKKFSVVKGWLSTEVLFNWKAEPKNKGLGFFKNKGVKSWLINGRQRRGDAAKDKTEKACRRSQEKRTEYGICLAKNEHLL